MSGNQRGAPRRRLIHRHGVVFEAILHPPDRPPCVLASDQDRPALVRISDTFGWPQPLPDWAGLAVRLFEPGVESPWDRRNGHGHLDLLLVSSVDRSQLWKQLRPHRDVLACAFSSGTAYRIGDVDQVVTAVPLEPRTTTLEELRGGHVACPLRYRLDVAPEPGEWRGLGDLELTRQHGDDPDLRFHPPPATSGRLPALRRVVYRWANGNGVPARAISAGPACR